MEKNKLEFIAGHEWYEWYDYWITFIGQYNNKLYYFINTKELTFVGIETNIDIEKLEIEDNEFFGKIVRNLVIDTDEIIEKSNSFLLYRGIIFDKDLIEISRNDADRLLNED